MAGPRTAEPSCGLHLVIVTEIRNGIPHLRGLRPGKWCTGWT
ncbi:hypothetical protein GZL_06933 [Streptomyces sp. 769]|nr:hypothetical protein GZL_06933 [Streptomyces sp. 769]